MSSEILRVAGVYCDGGLLSTNPSIEGGTWAWCHVNAAGDRIAEVAEGVVEMPMVNGSKVSVWRGQADADRTGRRFEGWGYFTPGSIFCPYDRCGNNLSEMMAMLHGLNALPNGWSGPVFTDSEVTIKRMRSCLTLSNRDRAKMGETLPPVMMNGMVKQLERLGPLTFYLLDGHPTPAHLESGVGKRGKPVSIHNKWCDERCNKTRDEFYKRRADFEVVWGA